MSFTKPYVNPDQASLTKNSDVQEVAKALGFGSVTTDNALMVQGQAFTAESLEDTITEIIQRDDQMEVLNTIKHTQAGNIIDQWNEVYSIGYKPGMSISNVEGMSKEGTRGGRRRYLRLKFQTARWGVNENVLAQPNFMHEFNKEDVAALTRLRQDQSWMIYEGDSKLDRNASGEPRGGKEFDGLKALISDPEYYGYYDGPMIYDCFTQGSGLDSQGLSNPADIETGVKGLAERMYQPENGGEQSPTIWMNTSTRALVQEYQNFEPLQILNGQPNDIIKGAIVNGFANPFTNGKQTVWHVDRFMPDIRNRSSWMVPASVRGHAVQATLPTVTATPTASDPESFFNEGMDGNYYYGVVPFGMDISKQGYEGDTVVSPVVAVAKGGKVTLTITAGTGGEEDGYLIYRSRRGGTNDPADMRLIKRIPRTGNTTTFVDLNRELPGASTLYLVDFSNPLQVDMRYLHEPIRIPLPRNPDAGRIVPAFVAHSVALRTRRHRANGMITNFMAERGWNPF